MLGFYLSMMYDQYMVTRKEPGKKFKFIVEIDGVAQSSFHEVCLPDVTTNVIVYREGSEASMERKMPGLTEYNNLILRSSITESMELYDWYKTVLDGKISDARRNMSVVLLDDEGQEFVRWDFAEAWPCRYTPPDLDSMDNSVALETF